jgi:hypothetical protein
MLLGFTSRKELSARFQCGEKTTRRILREIGIDHRFRLMPFEVEMFKAKVGDLVAVGENIKK